MPQPCPWKRGESPHTSPGLAGTLSCRRHSRSSKPRPGSSRCASATRCSRAYRNGIDALHQRRQVEPPAGISCDHTNPSSKGGAHLYRRNCPTTMPKISSANFGRISEYRLFSGRGESGRRARPMQPMWADNIRRQCDSAGVAFFFKQWGTWGADGQRRSKKANGRSLAGKVWDEMPT